MYRASRHVAPSRLASLCAFLGKYLRGKVFLGIRDPVVATQCGYESHLRHCVTGRTHQPATAGSSRGTPCLGYVSHTFSPPQERDDQRLVRS